MQRIRIDLNNYEKSSEVESDLVIIPKKVNDSFIPAMYFKKTSTNSFITDVSDAVWFRDVRIDTNGTQEEYATRVDWWFDNMDDEYKSDLTRTCKLAMEYGFDIARSVSKCRERLKSLVRSRRKAYLKKIVTDWVVRGSMFILKEHGIA